VPANRFHHLRPHFNFHANPAALPCEAARFLASGAGQVSARLAQWVRLWENDHVEQQEGRGGVMQPSADYPRDVTDRMIRESLSKPANLADLVREVVPTVAPRLAFDHAQLLPREFFMADWASREADLPFEVPLLSGESGSPALVLVLLEHQSDTDAVLPLRMLFRTVAYWARQWQQWLARPRPRGRLLLSPVIPIVLYTATLPWGSNTRLVDLLAGPEELHQFAPVWEPIFWNLSEHTPEELLNAGPRMQFLAVMRTATESREVFQTPLERAGRNLFPLAEGQAMRWAELLRLLFEYSVWRRPNTEQTEIRDTLRRTTSGRQETEEMGNTIAEHLIEQGQLKAARRYLRQVLEKNCGSLPEGLVQQIEAIEDLARLEAAFQRALRIQTLDDFAL
jgi:hypothetical protein